ncbi:hypothetical protein QMZ92_13235 [Streptomyces sp. HNM0645]|uniref:hypothetical protein n=1 Tax=Streptomyces sp. HNM0645 TaxID=2782343 RepID=UPI0024B7237B|nr:hypothetical protein [Streptomyces sp. HNM0645]MDI9885331.1 hypothetical protein [Streptomyces sp. HNM0645]
MAALVVIGLGMLALLAGAALVALAPPLQRAAYVLPAVRTVAILTAAIAYVAALWSHP